MLFVTFKVKPPATPNSKVSDSLKSTFFLSLNKKEAWGPRSKLTVLLKLTRWVKLNKLIFNIVYRSVKYEFIDILN